MTLAGGKPPTTNLLLGHERTRMIRSARKLGAVMGTTPVLVDPEAPAPAAQASSMGASMEILVPPLAENPFRTSHRSTKREGVIFTSHSSTSSIQSLLEKTVPEPLSLPSVAKLSLSRETRNSLHSVTRLRLVLTLTQPSPSTDPYSSSNCPYPSTDSLDVLQRSLSILISTPPPSAPDHAERRRKMVKLVNMLGGPIPPSLVFPPAPKPSPPRPQSRTERTARRRSRSVPPASTPGAPRKLVRPQRMEHIILPALSVDRISHPRPLASYRPPRSTSSSPMSNGTVSSSASRGRPVTPSYSLRRRGRESTQGSEP